MLDAVGPAGAMGHPLLLPQRGRRQRRRGGRDRGRRLGSHALLLVDVGLEQQPVDQHRVRPPQRLLHEARRQDVAAHVDVLAQVQPFPGGSRDAQLDGLARLAGHVAADAPFLLDVEAGGRVDVRLQAAGQVVEAGLVRDVAGQQAAGQILHAVRQLVPDAVEFVGRRMGRRRAALEVDDQRVQLDHLAVFVEGAHHHLAGDVRRQRRDGREDAALVHLACWPAGSGYGLD